MPVRVPLAAVALSLLLAPCAPVPAQTPETKAVAGPEGTPAAPADVPRTKPRKQPETLWDFFVAGGSVMYMLAACSIVWVAYFVERLFVLRRKRVFPPPLAEGLKRVVETQPFDRDRALALAGSHPSPAANVLRAAMERLHLPFDRIEKAVQNAAGQEVFQLRDRLWIFAIVATVAPLLGLLGTVIGLVQAFREVAISGLGAGATLAPGIYEALITTVGGLATAIPALVVYYWFQARIDRFVHEFDRAVIQIVDSAGVTGRDAPSFP